MSVFKSVGPMMLLYLLFLTLLGCIGDDIIMDGVDPVVRITNPIDTIAQGDSYQFEYMYLNEIGVASIPNNVEWTSSNVEVVAISSDGLATGNGAGSSEIKVAVQPGSGVRIEDQISVHVGETTVSSSSLRQGSIQSTSSYRLEGDFTIEQEGTSLTITFADNYVASSSLPGLYLYLTNNPQTINNALEISRVSVFSGAHSYTIEGVNINDYNHLLYFCKPFVVKVGDGEIISE
ncbi:MAG: hypothetical protein HKN87_04560 [Saprospiraceae bacterium]|nr:hypothetical protein [Saprospiraceae bacterium]